MNVPKPTIEPHFCPFGVSLQYDAGDRSFYAAGRSLPDALRKLANVAEGKPPEAGPDPLDWQPRFDPAPMLAQIDHQADTLRQLRAENDRLKTSAEAREDLIENKARQIEALKHEVERLTLRFQADTLCVQGMADHNRQLAQDNDVFREHIVLLREKGKAGS